jgi:predicted Ser/Thr protein kinase
MESIVREIARELKESQVPDKYRPISFEEYLKMVFEDPRLVRNAYQRLYDMILSHGTHIVKVHDKEVIRYNFFDDPFSNGEDAIYGAVHRQPWDLRRRRAAQAPRRVSL